MTRKGGKIQMTNREVALKFDCTTVFSKLTCTNSFRWVTCGSNTCRLFVQEEAPDIWLIKMVGYIVCVYTNMYLRVKFEPNITNGFRHLYQMIMDGKDFFRDDPAGWEIFLDRIEWNSYFLHYEHLILALLSDPRKDKRKKGKKLIMDARACEHEIDGVRFMYKTNRSQMNFAARDYSTFIKGTFIF